MSSSDFPRSYVELSKLSRVSVALGSIRPLGLIL